MATRYGKQERCTAKVGYCGKCRETERMRKRIAEL